MAEKFHINDKGEPGACVASVRPCQFGNEGEHYNSKEEASAAYESRMVSEKFTTFEKPSIRTQIDQTLENTLDEKDDLLIAEKSTTSSIEAKVEAIQIAIEKVEKDYSLNSSDSDDLEHAARKVEKLMKERDSLYRELDPVSTKYNPVNDQSTNPLSQKEKLRNYIQKEIAKLNDEISKDKLIFDELEFRNDYAGSNDNFGKVIAPLDDEENRQYGRLSVRIAENSQELKTLNKSFQNSYMPGDSLEPREPLELTKLRIALSIEDGDAGWPRDKDLFKNPRDPSFIQMKIRHDELEAEFNSVKPPSPEDRAKKIQDDAYKGALAAGLARVGPQQKER